MSNDIALRMLKVFGGSRAFAFLPGMRAPEKSGKLKPKRIVPEELVLTVELMHEHIAGKKCIGIMDGLFGCVDVDTYDFTPNDPRTIAIRAAKANLPLVVCRSKSGGTHAFLFTTELPDAAIMTRALAYCADRLGLSVKQRGSKGDTELICGTNVWLPHSGEPTTQCCVNRHGLEQNIQGFLRIAEAAIQTPAQIEALASKMAVVAPTPGEGAAHAAGQLKRYCNELSSMDEGQGRNNYLNKALHTMGRMVGAGWIERKRVEETMRRAAEKSGMSESEIGPMLDRTNGPLPKGMAEEPPEIGRHSPAEAITVCVADVEPRAVDWLWPGRIARGKLTLIGGEPGGGKSTLTCDIASRITTGGVWPMDEGQSPLGTVIMITTEDDVADTVKPRLAAAGADVARVHVLQGITESKRRRTFDLTLDAGVLEAEINRLGDVVAVIIDPVTAYQGKPGGRQDSHRATDVRAMLEPFQELAQRMSFALLVVTHLTKSDTGSGALSRFLGSIAMAATARAVYLVAKEQSDEDDDESRDPGETRVLFLPVKNNIGDDWRGFSYHRMMKPTGYSVCPEAVAIQWDDAYCYTSANDALRKRQKKEDGRRSDNAAKAAKLIEELLSTGPVPASEVEQRCTNRGFSPKSVRTAKKKLEVRSSREAKGWVWYLPGHEQRTLSLADEPI